MSEKAAGIAQIFKQGGTIEGKGFICALVDKTDDLEGETDGFSMKEEVYGTAEKHVTPDMGTGMGIVIRRLKFLSLPVVFLIKKFLVGI